MRGLRDAQRGVREGAKQLRSQTDAYAQAANKNDQAQAEETARALLEELSAIEEALKTRSAQAQA